MAINKQKILNELGSVMNQLQNAECGCMGKLFANSNPNESVTNPQTNCPAPAAAGEPSKPNAIHIIPQQATNVNAVDPSKLYLETQNYLQKNLVEPTIKEVHKDLQSISPANTITINPIGDKMMQQQSTIPPQTQPMMGQNNKSAMPGQPGTAPEQPMMAQNTVNAMGANRTNPSGMANINNGMRQGSQGQPSTSVTNHNTNLMDNMSDFQRMANTPGGMGPAIINMMTKKRAKPNDPPAQPAAPMNSNQNNSPNQAMTPQQQSTANNLGFNQQQQPITSIPVAPNPAMPQTHDNRSPEAKFHEMFPGIKNGMKEQGNLRYDPMAMAMQMNSGNQQIPGNNSNQNQAGLNANINHGGVANNPITGSNMPMTNNPPQNSNYQNMPNSMPPMAAHQQPVQGHTQMLTDPKVNPAQYFDQTNSQPPNMNQQVAPAINAGQGQMLEGQRGHINMPPPKNNVQFNALGQPVQLMPTNMYYSPAQKLPQTLSPQPVPMNRTIPNPGQYSNVRNTESRTSLMPRAASRSQLQQAYNQYRGAHSFVPQHNAPAYGYGGSHSDGQLNVPQTYMTGLPHAQLEKVGGDVPQYQHMPTSAAPPMGALGDVVTPQQSQPPLTGGKSRNGLQDMVYTSYPSSTSWSFHGKNSRVVSPFSIQ